MEKVVSAIATLMLVAVLVVSILTYAGIFNLSDTLNQIKTGVSKLVTWFIPEKYDIKVSLLVNGTYDGRTIKIVQSVSAGTPVALINVTVKGAPVELVLESNVAGFTISVDKASNATVVGSLGNIPVGTGLVLQIYPATGVDGFVSLKVTASSSITASTAQTADIYMFYKRI